jgi:hypothetical protein
MIPEFNLMPIKKGDTYALPLSFWEDECETTPIDVSGYTFKLMAKNSAGVTIFTWNNADFVQGATNERTVTLSSNATTLYTAGEFNYELQVTMPGGTYTWMQGYVQVLDQITS